MTSTGLYSTLFFILRDWINFTISRCTWSVETLHSRASYFPALYCAESTSTVWRFNHRVCHLVKIFILCWENFKNKHTKLSTANNISVETFTRFPGNWENFSKHFLDNLYPFNSMHCVLTYSLSSLSAKYSKALSQLRHTSFVNFSEVFHLGCSDFFKTSSRSVYNFSPFGNCSNKKSICWFNKNFSDYSGIRNYHKCIGISTSPCIFSRRKPEKLNQVRKMVWISDLDDPKVLWHWVLPVVQCWITIDFWINQKLVTNKTRNQ